MLEVYLSFALCISSILSQIDCSVSLNGSDYNWVVKWRLCSRGCSAEVWQGVAVGSQCEHLGCGQRRMLLQLCIGDEFRAGGEAKRYPWIPHSCSSSSRSPFCSGSTSARTFLYTQTFPTAEPGACKAKWCIVIRWSQAGANCSSCVLLKSGIAGCGYKRASLAWKPFLCFRKKALLHFNTKYANP